MPIQSHSSSDHTPFEYATSYRCIILKEDAPAFIALLDIHYTLSYQNTYFSYYQKQRFINESIHNTTEGQIITETKKGMAASNFRFLPPYICIRVNTGPLDTRPLRGNFIMVDAKCLVARSKCFVEIDLTGFCE